MNKHKKLFECVVGKLIEKGIRYDSKESPLGNIMLDIWLNDSFYVLKFQDDFIDFSKLEDDQENDELIPDIRYFNEKEFELRIKILLEIEEL